MLKKGHTQVWPFLFFPMRKARIYAHAEDHFLMSRILSPVGEKDVLSNLG